MHLLHHSLLYFRVYTREPAYISKHWPNHIKYLLPVRGQKNVWCRVPICAYFNSDFNYILLFTGHAAVSVILSPCLWTVVWTNHQKLATISTTDVWKWLSDTNNICMKMAQWYRCLYEYGSVISALWIWLSDIDVCMNMAQWYQQHLYEYGSVISALWIWLRDVNSICINMAQWYQHL